MDRMQVVAGRFRVAVADGVTPADYATTIETLRRMADTLDALATGDE